MKKLLLLSLKQKLLVVGAVVAVAAGGASAALTQPQVTGADTSPLVQQVQHNTDKLANHDARITNAESDIKDLQDKTSTAPSSNRVSVPAVNSVPPTSPLSDYIAPTSTVGAPVTTPIVVTQSGVVSGGQYDGYCHLTYSDNSTGYIKASFTITSNGNSQSAQDNCSDFMGQVKG